MLRRIDLRPCERDLVLRTNALRAERYGSAPYRATCIVALNDDIPIACDLMPALTTVHIPLAEMGARAVRLALETKSDELRVEHVAAHVVLRESTAAPNDRS